MFCLSLIRADIQDSGTIALSAFKLIQAYDREKPLQLMPSDFSHEKKKLSSVPRLQRQEYQGCSLYLIRPFRQYKSYLPFDRGKMLRYFATETGTPYSVQSWSRRLNAYGKKCGLNITAYHLRHASALLLLRRGG